MRLLALCIGALTVGFAMHAQAQENAPHTIASPIDWTVRTPETAKVDESHAFTFTAPRDKVALFPYVKTFEGSTLTDFVESVQVGGRVSVPFTFAGAPLLFEGEGSRETTYKAQRLDVGRLRISHEFDNGLVLGLQASLMQGSVKETVMFAPRIKRDWAFGIGGHIPLRPPK